MKIVLPWPDKRLSSNARLHWAAKVAPKKKARADAAVATYGAINGGVRELRAALAGDAPIPLTIRFFPPDARRRDRDNMQSSLKHALDGIADALGVDDYRFRPTYEFAAPEKPGRVEVTIGARPVDSAPFACCGSSDVLEESGPVRCLPQLPGPDHKHIGGADGS